MVVTISSPWGKPSAWALNAEEHEAELQQLKNQPNPALPTKQLTGESGFEKNLDLEVSSAPVLCSLLSTTTISFASRLFEKTQGLGLQRLPTSTNPDDMSPYQMVTRRLLDYPFLRAFGYWALFANIEKENNCSKFSVTCQDSKPASFHEAMQQPWWIDAMNEELQALLQHGTWELVPRPKKKNVIGCKWVYKIKHKFDGTIKRFKACLVAKGYNQQYGLDYEETFSLVVKIGNVRLVLAMANYYEWPLHQLDVKNAFLHEELQEEVYMEQPPRSKSANYLFLRKEGIILVMIEHSSHEMKVTQQKYALDLLKRFGLDNCKPAPTPVALGSKLSQKESTLVKHPERYRSLVGTLQYLTFTQPDITYVVNQVCQFMHDPQEAHLQVAKRILGYIKGTLHNGLFFSAHKTKVDLVAFSDADWGGDPDSRKSIFGFCVFFTGSPISLSSKKQRKVSRSSTKAEYKAVSDATAELAFACDNQSAMKLALNPVFHVRSKHFELDCHFIREKVEDKEIHLRFVPSTKQLADIFTKEMEQGDQATLLLLFDGGDEVVIGKMPTEVEQGHLATLLLLFGGGDEAVTSEMPIEVE
ncbi:hypothetical protein SLEP1_g39332 [Rubroshorea leprosula]|uniref:Reverse transcriptase Ty1/copia-type domain-containing protein n=1 Tax=Rubroshorea leprosula TaxID=152421 RepID=A0AAV5L064_9ROSI|nr:hypothetical protein SLEP1_g39332 [Rubroshorea leprosula]